MFISKKQKWHLKITSSNFKIRSKSRLDILFIFPHFCSNKIWQQRKNYIWSKYYRMFKMMCKEKQKSNIQLILIQMMIAKEYILFCSGRFNVKCMCICKVVKAWLEFLHTHLLQHPVERLSAACEIKHWQVSAWGRIKSC